MNSLFAEMGLTTPILQTLLPVHSVFNVITPNRMACETKLCLILVQGGTESSPHGKSL